MLLHLLQTLTAHSALAEGIAPPDLLHRSEQAQLDAFRMAMRRRDWLRAAGRPNILSNNTSLRPGRGDPPLPAILIAADPDGAPRPPRLAIPNPQSSPASPASLLSLSISHSGDRAFCALTDGSGVTVGADIERIKPRESDFIEQFFTPTEIAVVHATPADRRDTLITIIWSAKEAVLKVATAGIASGYTLG